MAKAQFETVPSQRRRLMRVPGETDLADAADLARIGLEHLADPSIAALTLTCRGSPLSEPVTAAAQPLVRDATFTRTMQRRMQPQPGQCIDDLCRVQFKVATVTPWFGHSAILIWTGSLRSAGSTLHVRCP